MDPILLTPHIEMPKTTICFGLDQLVDLCQGKRGVFVVDERVHFQKPLDYPVIAIANEKTRAAKEALEDALFQHSLRRDDLIIAVGGGTVTDLVAFTASTYMRGVPLILIPTTLLAMVDAAIGGKTAIDTPFGKNLIGTFYLPKAIVIDFDFLKTLPEIEMRNGLSEILKMGLIADPTIWELGKNWKQNLRTLIQKAIHSKCKIVEADYEEKRNFRRILNFGHTVGHGLELLSSYQMAHGEAVALGCMAESYLSHILGFLSQETLDEILTLYRNLGYSLKKIDSTRLMKAMTLDKKGKDRFVLIDRIGHPIPFDGPVEQQAIREMIEWMQHA